MKENRLLARDPKNILAIRFMRLGDVALLLPALGDLKTCYPESSVTLLTDERCAPLAEMCPSIDSVISVNRLEMRDGPLFSALARIRELIRDIRRRRFDLVIDFLSFRETNLLTWLSGAPYRFGMKRHNRAYLPFCFNLPCVNEDKSIHVAEMFQRIVKTVTAGHTCSETDDRLLALPDTARIWASEAVPNAPLLSLYVGAPVAVRRWPAERFADLANFAADELGASVAVLAGPADGAITQEVRKRCRRLKNLAVFNDISIPRLSAVIARSRLLVSNDTGPMHLGPALGVPTLGLFSVGIPEHYRPLGNGSRFLKADPIEKIQVQDVLQQVRQMWQG